MVAGKFDVKYFQESVHVKSIGMAEPTSYCNTFAHVGIDALTPSTREQLMMNATIVTHARRLQT